MSEYRPIPPKQSASAMQLRQEDLRRQTGDFRGRGGTSQNNRECGFAPVFRDSETGKVYPSHYADGRSACVHLIEGLPVELVLERDAYGRPVTVKGSLEPGFIREGRFYTREQAAVLVAADEGRMGEEATG